MMLLTEYWLKQSAVLALANVGPGCIPCGGPLKVIMQSKTRTNICVLISVINQSESFVWYHTVHF
jgi:hypothetical protein